MIQYQEELSLLSTFIEAHRAKKVSTPTLKKFSINKKGLPHGHPLQFLKNNYFKVCVKDTKQVLGTLVVNIVKTIVQNVVYMLENECFHIAKCIGTFRLDALADKFELPPVTSTLPSSIIRIPNAVFQLKMAFIDCGANGLLIAKNMLFIKSTLPICSVNVIGADDHTMKDCPIDSGIGKAVSQLGPYLVCVHKVAHFPEQEHSIFWGVKR